MSSHAALGVVRAGVAVLKGRCFSVPRGTAVVDKMLPGTGVRINCIAPGQIDVGVDLKGVCICTTGMPAADMNPCSSTCVA